MTDAASRTVGLAALLAAAMAAGPGAAAAAAPPAAIAKSRPADTGVGRLAPGADALVITFTDVPTAPVAARRLAGLGEVTPLVPEAGVWRLRPDDRATGRAAAARRPEVASAEWPLARQRQDRPAATAAALPLPSVTPPPITDPLVGRQWMLGADGWQPLFTGRTPRPTIAVLDSGVDRQHEEWAGKGSPLLPGYSVFPSRAGTGADDWDIAGHGTHVAGIAAAPANGVGIVGVAPARADGARVLPVQVADQFGEFDDIPILRGIRYAVLHGARVINISAGGETYLNALQETIYWATERGAVVVAAVGNEGNGTIFYPAAYQRVIGVGAQCGPQVNTYCPRAYGVARFSTRNRTVDVVAPGDAVLSTIPRTVIEDAVQPGYGLRSGTSMAAPYVSGVVALMQAAAGGGLSPDQVRRQLQRTAADAGPVGRDDASGYGAVNVAAAVTTPAPPDDVAEVNDDIRFLGRGGANLALGGRGLRVAADIDRADDRDDVYPVRVRRGQRLRVTVTNPSARLDVYVWGPRTRTVATGAANLERNLIGFTGARNGRQVLVVRASRTGRYFIDVYARAGSTSYVLAARALR